MSSDEDRPIAQHVARRPPAPRPTHPNGRAILLMVGVCLLIVVLALFGG